MSELAPRTSSPAPRLGPAAWWRDAALSAVNGAIGDRLRARSNGLALEMGFRHARRPLPPEREAIVRAHPDYTARACVLVHGLGLNELHWRPRDGAEADVEPGDFGSQLRRDLGYTPLYLRYNTGLRISLNGRRLADLLEDLADAWPTPLEEVLLVGHSMGGLVARSAAHIGHERGDRWVQQLRRIVCLGSPHLGAPLEKGAHVLARLLSAIPTEPTRIVGEVIDGRSVGIKDLRFGYFTDGCWQGRDADEFLANTRAEAPLVPGVEYCFVASSVVGEADHPLARMVGDVLVRVPSASGRGEPVFDRSPALERAAWCHFGRMTHFDLMRHPDVYRQIRHWCGRELPEGD